MKKLLLYIITLFIITSNLSFAQTEEITEETNPRTIVELEAKLEQLNKDLKFEEAKITAITDKAKAKLELAREKGNESEIEIAVKEYDAINDLILNNVSPIVNEILKYEEELIQAKEREDNSDFLDEDGEILFDINSEMKDLSDKYLENSPTINVQYGQTIASLSGDFSEDFMKNDFVQLKLGMTDYDVLSNLSNNLTEMDFKFVGYEQSLNTLDNSNGISYETWAFLVGSEEGKGWKIGEFLTITPYTGESSGWGKLTFLDSVQSPALQSKLNRIADGVRYMDIIHSGLNIQMNKTITLKADFSSKVVYPRFQVWKWSINHMITGVSNLVVMNFVKKINKRAPMAAPIMDFIFTNAINYGFLELQKKNMNWPYSTEVPFIEHNYNIGLSITF